MRITKRRLPANTQENSAISRISSKSQPLVEYMGGIPHVLAFISGFTYLVGLIVSNLRISQSFGAANLLPLIRIRYLMVGACTLFHAIVANSALLIFLVLWSMVKPTSVLRTALIAIIGSSFIITAYITLASCEFRIYDNPFKDEVFRASIIAILALSIIATPVVYTLFCRHSKTQLPSAIRGMFYMLLFFLLGGFLQFYAIAIYPRIPSSFGGGKPCAVKLLFEDKDKRIAEELGLLDDYPEMLYTSSYAVWSEPIGLVEATDDYYYICPIIKGGKNSKYWKDQILIDRRRVVAVKDYPDIVLPVYPP